MPRCRRSSAATRRRACRRWWTRAWTSASCRGRQRMTTRRRSRRCTRRRARTATRRRCAFCWRWRGAIPGRVTTSGGCRTSGRPPTTAFPPWRYCSGWVACRPTWRRMGLRCTTRRLPARRRRWASCSRAGPTPCGRAWIRRGARGGLRSSRLRWGIGSWGGLCGSGRRRRWRPGSRRSGLCGALWM